MDFATTPRILLKEGATQELPRILQERGCSEVLLVTDPGLVKAGVIKPILASLEKSNVRVNVFDRVLPDPPTTVIREALAAAPERADCVIGIGGGSSLDTAKLVAYLLRSPCDLDSIYGVNVAKGERLPLLLVPTTAGTGSEVTPIAIVTTESGEKKGVVAHQLLPDVAILDPLTTLSVPLSSTAATAIDAMVHAIEAYTSKFKKNPLSDALAREALQLLVKNFPVVMRSPDNVKARANMLLGSCLAGMAFANAPVAAVHALAYPLGARHHVPHGLSNALMLLAVMDFNMPAAKKEYAELGDILGEHGGGARGLKKTLQRIIAMSGLPTRLRNVGIGPGDVPFLAGDALQQTRLLVNNPVALTREDVIRLYESVF